MKDKSIFIVIPVHNRKEFTCDCLLSLRRQTMQNFKIIVVDDGSTDGTSEMIQEEFPEVTLLHGDGNLWWTGATNLGVQYALSQRAEYIMTLNDDTIATDDFIEKMMYWAQRKPKALLGALAIDLGSNKPVYGGERGDWIKGINLLDILTEEEQHGLHRVTHFPGRGLLIPRDAFQQIGLFDQFNFAQATADEDFTFRAARAGYEIYCNYDSKLLIRPNESGAVALRQHYSLMNYLGYLFGIKGGGNLKFYIIHVFKNCPPKRIPIALFMGISARVLGYLRDWAKFVVSKLLDNNRDRTRKLEK